MQISLYILGNKQYLSVLELIRDISLASFVIDLA